MPRFNARVRIAAFAVFAIVSVTSCAVMRWQIDGLKADLAAERARHSVAAR